MAHIPVLQKEVLEILAPVVGQNFIDATIGGGGHAQEILKMTSPDGKLLGIDLDVKAIKELTEKFDSARVILVCDNFANLTDIVKKNNFDSVDGILADLGFSSMELEERGRGFSFFKDEPLIMAYGESQIADRSSAAQIINSWSKEKLAKIFLEFGEEEFSRQIAKKIVESRRIKHIVTTGQLVEIIKAATPAWYHHRRLHPATKTFQALRIAVNDELDNLKKFLPQALAVLKKDGKLAVISFHSLEDRIIKNFFKEAKSFGQAKILTKKAIKPDFTEKQKNPRSRSAKLRALQKI